MADARVPVEWAEVETVLLDMDGTLLDLAFDNRFWLKRVPAQYAEEHDLDPDHAMIDLQDRMARVEGRLEWYCLDYWSQQLGFDLAELKQSLSHEIRILPGVPDFLKELTASGRRVAIATNAHPEVLSIKLEVTGLDRLVHETHTAHEFGAAKESHIFWEGLRERMGFEPGRTLFVDDSVAVLLAAKNNGIGHLRAIARPDSGQPARDILEFPAVDAIAELGPVPPKS